MEGKPLGKLTSKVYLKLCEWAVRGESHPHPLVFFLLYLYSHFFRNQHSLANAYIFSLLPIILIPTLRFNFSFMTAQFIYLSSPFLSLVIFFTVLCLGCNQKWKLYIFLFSVGSSLPQPHLFRYLFILLASGMMCHEIYYSLACKTLTDNRTYFVGFFVIFTLSIVNLAGVVLGLSMGTQSKIIILISAGLLAAATIRQRTNEITQCSFRTIRDSRILAFHLDEVEREITHDYKKKSLISVHRSDCSDPHCFCQSSQSHENGQFFIRQLQQNAINAFSHSDESLLKEKYIDFLLKKGQMLKALNFIYNWNDSSHFSLLAKIKCIQKIKKLLDGIHSSNLYEQEYIYALQYDQMLLSLTQQIFQILERKSVFWRESARETPLMLRLQQEGRKIVDFMYSLNQFYSQNIKKHEKKLYSFDATILYATYLLSTTNFKQYAQLIIKNTSKLLEQMQIFINQSSQAYAIKTAIKRIGQYQEKDDFDFDLLPLSGEEPIKTNQQPQYRMIIDNASQNLCKFIGISREELLGLEIVSLIPEVYRSLHKQQMSKILNFQNQKLQEIVSLRLHSANSKLGLKMGEDKLFMCLISIKTMLSLQEGYSFISLIKKVNDKTTTALVNFEGELSESEQGFCEEILTHIQFIKYFQIVKQRWREEEIVMEESFSIMMNSLSLSITISSPYAAHFPEYGIKDYPPFHVEVLNESTAKNDKKLQVHSQNKMIKDINHLQMTINHDSQSTTSSTNSSSVVNILSAFSEKNIVPVYRRVIITIFITISLCFIANTSLYVVGTLPWDNSMNTTNNPINDTVNFMKLQHITANILLNLWDVQEFLSNQNLNKTEVTNYLSSKNTYIRAIDNIFKSKFSQFKTYFYACLRSPSYVLSDDLVYRLETQVAVSNMSLTSSSIIFQTQNMSFESLLMVYLTDFNIMSQGVYNNSLLLPITFSETIANLQNATNFSQTINNSIDASIQVILAMQICMSLAICLLVVPIFCFLRQRITLHQRIFDLFAEIECEMVIKEINSLNYVKNIVKNYAASSQVLKANVIGYQQNSIYPKKQSLQSVKNEIVVGLQHFDLLESSAKRSQSSRFSQLQQNLGQNSFRKKKNKTGRISYLGDTKVPLKRKRAGDLDLTGSESDPSMRINKRHLLMYFMVVLFIVFLNLQASFTITYGKEVQRRKDTIIKVLDSYSSTELSLFIGKIYFRNGNAGLANVDPKYGFAYLQSLAKNTPAYDFTNKLGYDTVYQNCSKNGSINTKVVCSLNYSFLTLMAEFGVIYKQLFQARYSADQNYSASYGAINQSTYNQILANISAKAFYLQSVDNQLENIVYTIADNIYLDLQTYSQSVARTSLMIFTASACWWAFAVIGSAIILFSMKQQYLKEVYMLSFLNNQMISNNKRVESFLNTISKASS